MTTSPGPAVRALEALGLRHALHVNEEGHTYAGFRLVLAPDATLQCGMLRWGPSLVIRAHDVLESGPSSEDDLRDANALNLSWGLGRLYYSADRGAWEIATGVHFDGDAADPGAVAAAIESLCRVAGFLHADPETKAELRDDLPGELLSPYRAMPVTSREVEVALSEAGTAFGPRLDGRLLVQRFSAEGRGDFLVDIAPWEDRLLFVRGRLDRSVRVRETRSALDALQRINARLSLGAAGLAPEGRQPCFVLGLPLMYATITPALMTTLLEHAADATASLERSLSPA